ncbi:MAG: hypothetical protein HC935_00535 [Pseudanabaena sp. SU_2_4]|nr:hypothetical protein [Pseudanabaena sp. SU_2_4]
MLGFRWRSPFILEFLPQRSRYFLAMPQLLVWQYVLDWQSNVHRFDDYLNRAIASMIDFLGVAIAIEEYLQSDRRF